MPAPPKISAQKILRLLSDNATMRLNLYQDEQIVSILSYNPRYVASLNPGDYKIFDIAVATTHPAGSSSRVEGRTFVRSEMNNFDVPLEVPDGYAFLAKLDAGRRGVWTIFELIERRAEPWSDNECGRATP